MDAVAARAGVSKPTLYLRFPSKPALVFEAVFGRTKAMADPDTGELARDLRIAYSWVLDEFAAAEARAALPGLLGELAASRELRDLVRASVLDPEYSRVRVMLERGQARGELRTGVDLDLVIDVFTGTLLARGTLLDRTIDHAFADNLIALITQGMAPRPAGSSEATGARPHRRTCVSPRRR